MGKETGGSVKKQFIKKKKKEKETSCYHHSPSWSEARDAQVSQVSIMHHLLWPWICIPLRCCAESYLSRVGAPLSFNNQWLLKRTSDTQILVWLEHRKRGQCCSVLKYYKEGFCFLSFLPITEMIEALWMFGKIKGGWKRNCPLEEGPLLLWKAFPN